MYGDDIALNIAAPTFKQVETILSHDMNRLFCKISKTGGD